MERPRASSAYARSISISSSGSHRQPYGWDGFHRSSSLTSHVSHVDSEVNNSRISVSSHQPMGTSSLRHVDVDELNSLDLVQIGDTAGSIRLKQFRQGKGVKRCPMNPPYSAQDAVLVQLSKGKLSILLGASDALIYSTPFDLIEKVRSSVTGIFVEGSDFEVVLTIHNEKKRSMLFKLLMSKTKGVFPVSTLRSVVRPRSATPSEWVPKLAAASPMLERKKLLELEVVKHPETIQSSEVLDISRSPIPSFSAQREKRKEVLYAQLRKIRHREAQQSTQ